VEVHKTIILELLEDIHFSDWNYRQQYMLL